ncbi:MAG: glycosyltransferase [Cyclobacteriaceae bacterium]
MKIVFLSHTIRSSIFKVGSYHLSKHMASLGHEVLYISSPLSVLHLLDYYFLKRTKELKKRIGLMRPKSDNDGVINFIPLLLFPYLNKRGLDSYKFYKNFNLDLSNTKKLIASLGFTDVDLVVQDSVKLNYIKKKITSLKWIYRATDLYTHMPEAPSTLEEAERETISFSDFIFCTSGPLQQYLEKKYEVSVSVLINGVAFDFFTGAHTKPPLYDKLNDIKCVYVGSMDARFDYNLIENLSTKSKISIILIGPVDKSRFARFNNIHCLGEIENHQLPPYLKHADVGLLPLKVIDANHSRSPMKIYEYGAAGLPVISTGLMEIMRRDNKAVLVSHNNDEFYDFIVRAYKERETLKKIAVSEASTYSWESITKDFLSRVL